MEYGFAVQPVSAWSGHTCKPILQLFAMGCLVALVEDAALTLAVGLLFRLGLDDKAEEMEVAGIETTSAEIASASETA